MLKQKLPNYLTITRGVLTILIILCFFWPVSFSPWLILIFFILACLTDWLDGLLARRWQVVSDFGKIFDPLFDKVLTISLYFLLGATLGGGLITVFALLIVRELVVDSMKNYMLSKNEVVPAITSAKIKTTSQMLMLLCLLSFLVWPNLVLLMVGYLFGFLALFMAYWSGIIYWRRFWKFIK
ncbi:MAG: CDP-diacylglycerol-glycerol-3-phosphate 3-phosphatidyltransferase [Candidatus Falkowbacteria bacterium GW2011_GWA2_39_24]|uniref:CDP-diacylglycerol--glycerol-3-phosphate 3-phosphatidyltransferase n=1 Tax=Candidatus Falkowbacteria bacterium GW2011_GWA2_39_24 TaxID=1618634 RepID=A0A0G0RMT9_9BACT|nr:MAG: CDP-diacylglycerol-glycerol-3-phosphate 3-phosphatidyltransferase [Candidatus Falkowbacteria bacterium GW2011_GWA2_39_24]